MTAQRPHALTPLERRILKTLRARTLVRPGDRGLVLVSGGPDSMALLYILHALAERLELRLEVVHFDHGLRQDSRQDAEWVAARAAELELPTHIVRATHLAGLDSGVQAAARTWRRQEGQRLLAQWEARWIATGHQREDTQETWLLKWLRGAHLSGLRGMAWKEGPTIRPLLGATRAELTAYLEARGAAWLEDPSNRDSRYKRNRVRHELLPLLNELAGDALAERLEDLEAQSRELAHWLEAVLEAQPPPGSPEDAVHHWIGVAGLRSLPPLARETALHRFVTRRAPGLLPRQRVREALDLLESGSDGWRLDWSRGRRLRREGERLILESVGMHPPRSGLDGKDACTRVGAYEIAHPPWLSVREGEGEEGLCLNGLPDGASVRLRTRQPGDRFHPAWARRPVKLKDFLRDQHVPLAERDALPLVVVEGDVAAVYPRFVARAFAQPARNPEHTGVLRLVIDRGK